jgi:undecaprenyl-diphosphatase
VLASLGSIDRHAFLWVVHHRISLLNPPFKLLTYIGTGGTFWVALALLLAWRTRRPLIPTGLLAAVVVWGADGITSLLKVVTHRSRPFSSIPDLSVLIGHPNSGSFPSAHATTAFAGAALLNWLWPRGRIAFAALAILIAFSRVYLGVHYPTDVLGGAAIGAAFAVAVIAGVQRTRFRDRFARPLRSGTA